MLIILFVTQVSLAAPLAWLPSALTSSTPTIRCEESPSENLSQRCAQDLCGLPGTNPSVFVEPGSLDGFTPSPSTLQDIARVEQGIDQATRKWKEQVENYLKESSKKLQDDDIDPKLITGITDYFAPYVSYQVVGERILIKTDFPEGASQLLRAGVSEWAKNREASVQTNTILRLQLGLDSIDAAKQTMRERTKAVEQMIAKPEISSQIPPVQLNQLRQSMGQVNDLLNRPLPPVELLENVHKFLDGLEANLDLPASEQFSQTQQVPFDKEANEIDQACKGKCLQLLSKEFTKDAIAKRIETLRQRLETERGELLSACRTGILLQAKMGQLPDQRERALGLVDAALGKIQTSGLLSSSTSSGFGKMIQQNTDVESTFPAQLLTGGDFLKAYSQMAEARVAPSFSDQIEDDLAVIIDLSQTSGNLYGRDFRGCPSARHLATDFFWPGIQKPLIHVSPHSCAHPSTGLSVVAHELGHALSHFISEDGASTESSQTYLRRRQCVVGLSPIIPVKMPEGAQQKFTIDRLTTEEDMADWVMQKAVPFDQHPSSCDFLKVTADGKYDPKYLDILPHEGDTHSGSLMRMVREWHSKHASLPASCQQLVNAHSGIVEARACE